MGMIGTHPGGVLSYSTGNGGKITAVTLGTTTAPIIGVNGGRQSIVFHNPALSGRALGRCSTIRQRTLYSARPNGAQVHR
jgi:hypothetical protein